MGNACICSSSILSKNSIIECLSSWPGTVLEWSEHDLKDFVSCFSAYRVAAGKEILTKDPKSFFIVAEGSVEVQAILPTIRKKTGNIREFLCKKDKGDMVYAPSMRKLISESTKKEMFEREDNQHREHGKHKNNLIDIVDTVTIKSITSSIILQLDWNKFNSKFMIMKRPLDSKIDISMLRSMMETNLNDYLEKLPILADMANSKLETMVRMCRYSVQKQGSVICREGDLGQEVFLVLSGEVKVEAFASKRMVELLGDSVFSGPSAKRKSVRFKDETKPPMSNTKSMPSHTKETESILSSTGNSQKKIDCRRRTLFEAGRHFRRELVKTANYSGEIDITHSVELARLGPGDYFGEMATLIELPRAATVTATTNVLMASLSKTDFKTLLIAISPNLEVDFERMVKLHMLQNLFQLKSPFIEKISIEKINVMAEKTTIKKMGPSSIVFEQGDEANSFYFVYSGSLKVRKRINTESNDTDTFREVGYLFPGDYFGELALLNKSNRRLATISTMTGTVVLEITREDFYNCFRDTPEIISEFIVRMKGRNVDLSSLLEHTISKQVFIDYLNEHHGEENIKFYDAVSDFEACFDSDINKEEVETKAKFIIDTYLTENSPDAVNVTSEMYKNAQGLLLTESFAKHSFKIPKREIYSLLERDLFPRFRKSKRFTNLMERVRTYDDIDVQLLA